MNKLFSFKILTTLVFCLFSYGFSGTLYDQATNAPDLPKGDPDPEKGIVVRIDSDAYDVLRESSNSIRLGVNRDEAFNDGDKIIPAHIGSVRTLMPDRQPKKFTYIDDERSFTLQNTYGYSFHFTSSEGNKWDEIDFYAFVPFEFQYTEQIEERLREITTVLDDTGWIDITERHWRSFAYPKLTDTLKSGAYKQYAFEDMRIMIFVELGIPAIHKFTEDKPKYNISISMVKGRTDIITN